MVLNTLLLSSAIYFTIHSNDYVPCLYNIPLICTIDNEYLHLEDFCSSFYNVLMNNDIIESGKKEARVLYPFQK